MSTRSAVSAYLDCVQGLYPWGVPRSVIGAARSMEPGSEAVKPLLVAGSPKSATMFAWLGPMAAAMNSPFEDPAGELLRNAIEKGLRRPISEVFVARSSDARALRQAVDNFDGETIIALGAATGRVVAPSTPEEFGKFLPLKDGTQRLLVTPLPEEVLSSSAVKREFWGHLQLIMQG